MPKHHQVVICRGANNNVDNEIDPFGFLREEVLGQVFCGLVELDEADTLEAEGRLLAQDLLLVLQVVLPTDLNVPSTISNTLKPIPVALFWML